MLDRAIDRGEIAASVDRDVVLDLFFGAAEHRLLLGHLPMTGEFIAEVVDVILAGVAGRLGRWRVSAASVMAGRRGHGGLHELLGGLQIVR